MSSRLGVFFSFHLRTCFGGFFVLLFDYVNSTRREVRGVNADLTTRRPTPSLCPTAAGFLAPTPVAELCFSASN